MKSLFLNIEKMGISLFFLTLLLLSLPAQAATYTFPGSLPAGCSDAGGGNYNCGVLTLSKGDTVTIAGTIPATITFSGAFTTGGSVLINLGGLSSDLNLVVNGVLTLGAHTKLNANVNGNAAIDLGIWSTLGGNLTATSTTGVVTLAANSTVGGYISTDAGAITIGNQSTVNGNVTSTGAGVVTLNTNIKVGGNISSNAGAITIGNQSTVCGNVTITGAGVATLTTNIKVGGSISTVAGAITVGAGSTVGGNVIPTGAGVVTMTGVLVGGNIITDAGAITLTDSQVRGNVYSTGAGVVTLTNSTINDTGLIVPAACSSFNHIQIEHDGSALTCTAETLTVKACANAACSSLYTASNVTGNVTWAGAPGGSIPFTITGGGTGQTTVSLPVATAQSITLGSSVVSPAPVNASQCRNTVSATNSCAMNFSTSGFVVTVPDHVSCTNATATIEAVQQGAPLNRCIPAFASVTRAVNLFTSYISPATGTMAATASTDAVSTSGPGTAHNLAFDATGKATITFNYPDAGQLTLTANGIAPTGAIMTGNATFVVAPASLVFSGIPAAPLTAGQSFNVTVTARNACAIPATTPNFTGQTVTVTSSNPQPGLGNATAINASLTATGGSGSTNLTWGEVGTIDLTASRSSYLGSALSVSGSQAGVGRFQPAYFDTVVTPGCSAFTYAGSTTPAKAGQPFTVTTTARAVGGGITKNYAGASHAYLTTLSNAGVTTGFTNNSMAATDFANGTATRNNVTYAVATPQTAPLTLTLRATNSDTPVVSSSGFTEGTTEIRSGRARLINAYGSELLDLPMPLTAQYWNGSAWTLNGSDTCTTGVNLALTDVSATDGLVTAEVCVWDTGSPGNSGLGCAAAGTIAKRFSEPPAAGNFNLNFRTPGAGNSGSVDVTATVPTWLQFDWKGTPLVTTDDNPTARATFGIYKTPIIYMRENY